MNPRRDIKIWVEDLTIAESGTYRDQFLRPYVTEVKGDLIGRIEERFEKARKFTPSILANIANQFIVPDFRPRGLIEIPHGWGERRGRFILTLVIQVGTGDKLKQIVMGYTNSVGFTTRNVDHDMEFYVNNTFMLRQRFARGAGGRTQQVWVPDRTNDVLSDRENAGLRRRGPELFTMRPEDVFSALDSEQTLNLVQDVTDLRTTLSKNAIKSSTSNRLAPRFMSTVLNSRQKALETQEYGSPLADINATAQGYAQESYASDDQFLIQVRNGRGVNMISDNFTFRELLRLDPDAEDRTNTLLLDDNARGTTRFHEERNGMDGQEEEDRVAALIGMAVPALMMECGLQRLDFQCHNQGTQHTWEFIPQNARSFVKDMDLTSFIEMFEDRLIDELLVPITANNEFDIGLKLSCRVFGEVDFTLFWNEMNCGRFVIPCFTNSLASPIVTDSRDDIRKMSRDFDTLFDTFLPVNLAGGGSSSDGGGYSF